MQQQESWSCAEGECSSSSSGHDRSSCETSSSSTTCSHSSRSSRSSSRVDACRSRSGLGPGSSRSLWCSALTVLVLLQLTAAQEAEESPYAHCSEIKAASYGAQRAGRAGWDPASSTAASMTLNTAVRLHAGLHPAMSAATESSFLAAPACSDQQCFRQCQSAVSLGQRRKQRAPATGLAPTPPACASSSSSSYKHLLDRNTLPACPSACLSVPACSTCSDATPGHATPAPLN